MSVPYTPQSQRHTRDMLEKADGGGGGGGDDRGKSSTRGKECKRTGGRKRETDQIHTQRIRACKTDCISNEHCITNEHCFRLLSIHARRRPIVRRVDNFKTIPTGPAAHCAKITGTPVKREQKRRGRNERGWMAATRSFVRSFCPSGGWQTCAFILY